MELLFTILLLLFGMLAFGQNKPAEQVTDKQKQPVKISLLSNYYEQDGNRSAINGGLGSQELKSICEELHIYVPVKDSSAINVKGGIDYFTSASLKEIDKYKTAASSGTTGVSGSELRSYGGISYDYACKKTKSIISPSIGFSTEYDVSSVNGALSHSRHFVKNDAGLISSLSLVVDRWMVVHPGEFRSSGLDASSGASVAGASGYASPFKYTGYGIKKNGEVYPIDWRQSVAFTNAYSFSVNQKMNAAVGLDLLMQTGLLSTPFHRVYFNDGVGDEYHKEVRIERLPRERYKAALSGRFNYFVAPRAVIKTQARVYADTWDIYSVTLSIETALKINKAFSFAPFYRFHYQQGTSYYKAYGRHVYEPEAYYTSDIDLATFSAHKAGTSLRYTPFRAMTVENGEYKKRLLSIKDLGLRYASYWRLDGLTANIVTFEINFEL